MARKNRNASLRHAPKPLKIEKSNPPPKIELVKPEPEPVLQLEQPISVGGGYKNTWMKRKGVG